MVFFVLSVIARWMALCGIAYWALTLLCALRFKSRQRRPAASNATPGVSVLKPLCGLEPEAYENLRSHCLQDYPEFELIFGVREPNDPVVPVVERLIREFPRIPIRLVVCPKTLGTNLKVSSLIQMLQEARHATIVVNDSDIRVPEDYLRRVVGPLGSEDIGLTTCLYRGVASETMGSRLESLAIASDFMPGVLFASQLEGGVHFAMGSTLAFRRPALDAIGGLEAIVDYLADDYELGARISRSGLKVVFSDCIVDHHLPRYSMSAFFQHQLRWGRTVRGARPVGYAGLVFTFAVPWAIAALALAPAAPWAPILLAAALVVRFAAAIVFGRFVLNDRQALRDLSLLPFRDCLAAGIFIACYAGRRVVWRGNTFEVDKGKLRCIESSS